MQPTILSAIFWPVLRNLDLEVYSSMAKMTLMLKFMHI